MSLGKLRIAGAAALGALALAVHAAPAGAATIGQLAVTPANACLTSDRDVLQPTVISGTPFVVPQYGATITSWSHNGGAGAGREITFKLYRKVAEPSTYQVVAIDGPKPIVPGVNTFTVQIAAQPGDVIGLNSANAATFNNSCVEVVVGGETHFSRAPGLAVGQSNTYMNSPNSRVNVTAEVKPSSTFTLGKAKVNKKKGTATLSVDVPGPGELALSGKTVKTAGASSSGASTVKLKVRPRGKAKRKLSDQGKAKVSPQVTFTPSALGGAPPTSQTTKIKLKKN